MLSELTYDELSEETRNDLLRECVVPIEHDWHREIVYAFSKKHGINIEDLVVDVDEFFIEFDTTYPPGTLFKLVPEAGLLGTYSASISDSISRGMIWRSGETKDNVRIVFDKMTLIEDNFSKELFKELKLEWDNLNSNQAKLDVLRSRRYDLEGNII